MTEVLTVVVFGFILSKFTFSLLDWFFRDDGDAILRRNLDNLWVKIHDVSFRDAVFGYFDNLVTRINETFQNKRKFLVWYFFIGLVLNGISALIGYFIWAIAVYESYAYDPTLWEIFMQAFNTYTLSWSRFSYAFILISLVSFAGVIVDILSIIITWKLVNLMAKDKRLYMLYIHLLFDIILALMAILWAYAALFLSAEVLQLLNLLKVSNSSQEITRAALIASESAFMWYAIVVGLTSCIPTVLYILLGIILALLHVVPSFLRSFFIKIIYLVTTDKKSVLSQLGNLAGGISALLAGAIKLT